MVRRTHILKKLLEEIDAEIVKPYMAKNSKLDFCDALAYDKVLDMHYLSLIVQETMRYTPTVMTSSLIEMLADTTLGSHQLEVKKGDYTPSEI